MRDAGSIGGSFGRGWDELSSDDEEEPFQKACVAKDRPALLEALQTACDAGQDFIGQLNESLAFGVDNATKAFGTKVLGEFLHQLLGTNLIQEFSDAFHRGDSPKMQKILRLVADPPQERQINLEELITLAISEKEQNRATHFLSEQKELFLFVDLLSKEDLAGISKMLQKKKEPVVLLEKAIDELPESPFAKRLIAYVKVLTTLAGEKEHLSPIESLKIARYVENRLKTAVSKETDYVTSGDARIKRTLLFPASEHSFVVLSKKVSELAELGSDKKVTYAFKVSVLENQLQVTRFVRLVNIADEEVTHEVADKVVRDMEKEAVLSKRFNNDVHYVVAHTNKEGKAKRTLVVEAYDKNLASYLRFGDKGKARLTSEQLPKVLQIIATKLAEIHRAGFVHFDIKGANIVISILPNGTILLKFIDFSKSYNNKEYVKSEEEENGYGSAAYSAPESFNPELKLQDPLLQGQAEDMYALGCTLYSMIYGQEVPWAAVVQRAIDTPADVEKLKPFKRQNKLYNKLTTEPPPAPELQKLHAICLALLQPNPALRMTSEQFLQAVASPS